MAHSYGEPMNERDLRLYFEGLDFKCERCDFKTTLYIEDKWDILNKDPVGFAKAYGTFIGYHATVIRPELNGFVGYDCIHFEVVSKFEEGDE